MSEQISYCGLDCGGCPIYLAARETDITIKEKMHYAIIADCKAYYGVEYNIKDINPCDGCKSQSGRLFFGCKECKIKKCAEAKRISSCAYCEDYPCDELNKMFKADPCTKKRLDIIRAGFQS